MLSQLTIQNFGLIDSLAVEFTPRLNVLTGATGAGKSIIIEALRIALGDRLKTSQIRDEQKPCVVEAVFEIPKSLRHHPNIADYLSADEPVLIINRQSFADGRNKIKINGQTVTVGQLKAVGDRLVDFHGPHDHQMLLSEESHLGILDQLVDFGDARRRYDELFNAYRRLKDQLSQLEELSQTRDREMDLLEHQVRELSQVPLNQEKFDELSQDVIRVNNAEKLYEYGQALLSLFESEESGVSEQVRKAFSPLKALAQIDQQVERLGTYLDEIQTNSEALVSELRDYLGRLAFEPSQAQEINRQYDLYEGILRKYGPSLADAARFFEEAKKKFELLRDFEQNDAELRSQITAKEKELSKAAQKLTEFRKKTAESLERTIEKELKDLGIEHVAFEARISKVDFNLFGHDQVVFYISPNAGEDLKPLAEIVSSGEAARLMLALKKALTKVDPIPVLIFDEIDAQIGGRLGTITGTKLKELSRDRQVILITHLPQIASFADRHFKVIKEVSGGKTFTRLNLLDGDPRIQELAQMMGQTDRFAGSAGKKTDVSISHAQEMLAKAQRN